MEKIFRISLKKAFYSSVSGGIVLFIVCLLSALLNFFFNGFSIKTFWESILIAFVPPILIVLFLNCGIYFLGFIFPVRIYSDRISATNYWGKRLSFNWYELESIELAEVSGLSYLVFSNQTGKKIWVPLLISNLDSFIDCLLERTKLLNSDFHKIFLEFISDKEADK